MARLEKIKEYEQILNQELVILLSKLVEVKKEIKTRELMKKCKEISLQIKQAKKDNNVEKIYSLTREFNNLTKVINKSITEEFDKLTKKIITLYDKDKKNN